MSSAVRVSALGAQNSQWGDAGPREAVTEQQSSLPYLLGQIWMLTRPAGVAHAAPPCLMSPWATHRHPAQLTQHKTWVNPPDLAGVWAVPPMSLLPPAGPWAASLSIHSSPSP